MFDTQQRAVIRAALKLWLMAARTSPTHPSEVPGCKVEFIADNVVCPTTAQIEALIFALEQEIVYTTVTLAAEKFRMNKNKLKRELDKLGYKPVPGSKVYSMCDVIIAANEIIERNRRGFFG